MTVTDLTRPAPAELAEVLRSGDIVARYTYIGDPGSDEFKLAVVMGDISDGTIITDPAYDDTPIVPVATAAKVEIDDKYTRTPNAADMIQRIRNGTKFLYGQNMLMRHFITEPSEIETAVAALTDNQALAEAGTTWQISTAGLLGVRAVHRALYKSGGGIEVNLPYQVHKTLTHSEIRCDVLSYVGAKTLDAFMLMPRTDHTS